MSAKTGKRPLRSLSAHEKLDAIRRVHDGESKASVARDIGVPESTLRGWCKNENKISYLSRQSSPETDESNTAVNIVEQPKEKRPKIESSPRVQPFNLSLKSTTAAHIYTPTNSEALYTPLDYTKNDMDCTPKTPQNLSIKTETPKSMTASQMTEREKNRAELARISVELGLNRPEMFASNTTNNGNASLTDLNTNLNLLSHHWNSILMQQQLLQNGQQQNKKVTSTTDSAILQQPKQQTACQNSMKLPKEQQSVDDYIKCWLKTQEALLTSRPRTSPTATASTTSQLTSPNLNGITNNNLYQSSWFWKWYKGEAGYNPQAAIPTSSPEKPILYQQLTKKEPAVTEAENLTTANTKVRTALDNILINNNNITYDLKRDKYEQEVLDPKEAIEHGEKFLRWLESCSNPSITAMQIMQFKTLLNNVRNGAERKNGEHNKTKVKRK